MVVLELALLGLGRGTLLQSYRSLGALLGGVFEDLVGHHVIGQQQLKSIIKEVMQLKQLVGVRKSKDPFCIFSRQNFFDLLIQVSDTHEIFLLEAFADLGGQILSKEIIVGLEYLPEVYAIILSIHRLHLV